MWWRISVPQAGQLLYNTSDNPLFAEELANFSPLSRGCASAIYDAHFALHPVCHISAPLVWAMPLQLQPFRAYHLRLLCISVPSSGAISL